MALCHRKALRMEKNFFKKFIPPPPPLQFVNLCAIIISEHNETNAI